MKLRITIIVTDHSDAGKAINERSKNKKEKDLNALRDCDIYVNDLNNKYFERGIVFQPESAEHLED